MRRSLGQATYEPWIKPVVPRKAPVTTWRTAEGAAADVTHPASFSYWRLTIPLNEADRVD